LCKYYIISLDCTFVWFTAAVSAASARKGALVVIPSVLGGIAAAVALLALILIPRAWRARKGFWRKLGLGLLSVAAAAAVIALVGYITYLLFIAGRCF